MNVISCKFGMKGFLRGRLYNVKTNRYRVVTDWIPNAMLLSGMNQMADFSNWAGGASKCHVGTVSVPAPSTTDTQLLGYVDGTATIVENTSGAQPSVPFYGWDRTTYQFPVGPIGGQNLQEGGIGWATAHSPAALICRALFTDGMGGNPTFTPLPDEVMQVQYELRYYPPLSDVLGTVTLNGTVYDTVTRAALVAQWGENIGIQMGVWSTSSVNWKAYDGLLGTIEQNPNGLNEDNDNTAQFNHAYGNNNFYVDMQCDCGVGGWILAAGIRSIAITTNAGFFQTQFTAQGTGNTIPKTLNDFSMSLVWRLAWSEKILP